MADGSQSAIGFAGKLPSAMAYCQIENCHKLVKKNEYKNQI
jgi:hypothetical protein